MDIKDAKVGQRVEYTDGFKLEKGIIKSFNDKYIFVVFHCDDNWDNYSNYTAQSCKPDALTKGKELEG